MNFEEEIFKRLIVDFEKLKNYGFVFDGNNYRYSKVFMDSFRADITVDKNGKLKGEIYDLNSEDLYFNFRIESQVGEFVGKVRAEYKSILEDIANSCFIKVYFSSPQANRIANAIFDMYGDSPLFIFEKYPYSAIFKNPNSNKWYGLIVNIDKSKLDKRCSGYVEVLDLKLNAITISKLLNKECFYPAYHMNKKNWISIVLDDTLSDKEIISYIKESHSYTEKK